MADRTKEQFGRRQLLRTGIFGIIATAMSARESGAVAADTENQQRKTPRLAIRRTLPRFKNYYRVNRYPKR